MNFTTLFETFANAHVVVVGDIMLDTYWWGHVDRISPEAPVPIVSLHHKELRVGGASNVALNTASLGAKTTMISVLGADADGDTLKKLMADNGISTSYIIADAKRITTNKTRVMGRNQQMMRIDSEVISDLDNDQEAALIASFTNCIEKEKVDVVILEDYNKGVLTEKVISAIISLCKAKKIVTAVDPKKKNFLSYKGVDLFKPNLKEVKEGLNIHQVLPTENALGNVHDQLHAVLGHGTSLITLSEHGIFYKGKEASALIPTHVRNIADVSGAGDTVIAVASLVLATTNNMHLAAEMANIAGGLVCEEVGTAAIDKHKLLTECKTLLS
jgi:D-glycero-beta-D-manno-heptose-7-phosphate kinase